MRPDIHFGIIREGGFSLLELMITLAVTAILLAVGVPSFQDSVEKRRTISAAEEIYGQLQLARSEAVARSQPVFMNIATGANWAIGISDNVACDPSDNNPVCTLPDMQGGNAITHRFSAVDHDTVGLTATAASISFLPQRGTANSASINVTSTGGVGYIMRVNVGALGQISMCSPDADASKYVLGYRAC